MNSEKGEFGEQTVFTYHQNGRLLWASIVEETSKCHSVPTVLDNRKIELSEQWKWTSGDYSKGESLLAEV